MPKSKAYYHNLKVIVNAKVQKYMKSLSSTILKCKYN